MSWKMVVRTEEEKARQLENYRKLMQKLVKTKLRSESEASNSDSFKDLRVDIQNELSELKSMIAGCEHCSTKVKTTDISTVWETGQKESAT